MGSFDKLWLEFPTAFWTNDLDNDWINYLNDNVGQFTMTLNLYKYLKIPVLLMFTVAEPARTIKDMSDNDVLDAAMLVI